jgi:integrase
MRISDVKKVHLQKLLNAHEGKSFSHVKKSYGILRELFEAAIDEELLLKNPARGLALPKYEKGERAVFTDEEYAAVLEVARTHRAGAWVLSMLRCGLRPQETVALLWSDVDFENGMIAVNKAAYFVSNAPKLKETKTSAGDRIVPLDALLFEAFQKLPKTAPYVFPKANGGMSTKTKIRRLWDSFLRELDIHMGAELYRNAIAVSKLQENLTPYSCRHTCITRLVLSGADPKTVQVFAGHEHIETTLKYYTHLDKRSAARRIADFRKCDKNVFDS